MTINELKNIVEGFLNKESFGSFSPDEFNSALLLATSEYFAERLPESKGRALVYQRNQKVADDLRSLKKRQPLTPNFLGQVSYPSDYKYGLQITRPSGKYQKEIEVDVLKDAEWAQRTSSVLIDPADYPIARFDNDYIQIMPGDERVILHYLRKPVTPVWGYTMTAVAGSAYGRPTYDASTTVESDFQDSPSAMLNLLYKVCQHLGLNVTRGDVVQFSAQKDYK